MQTDAFKEAVEKRAGRRNGAQKAVETKKQKLHAEIEEKIKRIKVKRYDLKQVRGQTISDKQDWYDYQASMRSYNCEYRCAKTADEATVRRWMVNYIRHNLTKYDDVLFDMSGRVGCHDEYDNYKEAVLDKIAEVYPELKQECEDQKWRV